MVILVTSLIGYVVMCDIIIKVIAACCRNSYELVDFPLPVCCISNLRVMFGIA